MSFYVIAEKTEFSAGQLRKIHDKGGKNISKGVAKWPRGGIRGGVSAAVIQWLVA